MSTEPYSEFRWANPGAANGQTGVGLAKAVLARVTQLEGVERVCDLGCGNGYLTSLLADVGYEVTGVDASETGIRIAQQNYSRPHFIRSLIDKSLGDRATLKDFDLAISSDVIEHMYRPADLLEAAANVLKPHGQIIIGTPYHGYLKNLALAVTGKLDTHFSALDTGGHIKFFSVKTLSALLQDCGFDDLHFGFYGRAPWLWMNMICYARKRS
jgi:2-polyprenyl-3-methyl-5-hydroxy-6-metoxy-1,4-benzoquinol methylase